MGGNLRDLEEIGFGCIAVLKKGMGIKLDAASRGDGPIQHTTELFYRDPRRHDPPRAGFMIQDPPLAAVPLAFQPDHVAGGA